MNRGGRIFGSDAWVTFSSGRPSLDQAACLPQVYKFRGLTASQVVRLIGLLLVFASQKIVRNVRNEMAESIVPLRKKIKDNLTRQGMWNIRGLHRKGLAEREEKERVLSSERAHKQVLTVKKNMHLILNSCLPQNTYCHNN